MKKNIIVMILLLMFSQVFLAENNENTYFDTNLTVEERVNDLLSRMTLREKIGQLDQYLGTAYKRKRGNDSAATKTEELIKKGYIGSLLIVSTAKEANELQRLAESSRLKIPLLIAQDAIHGHALYYGATVFPTAVGIASTGNLELAKKAAEITAKELRATGYQWTFSPNVDVTRDPRWGRTGETFGEDPFLVGEMGKAFVIGYQGDDISQPNRVLSCIKHFVAGGQPIDGKNFAPMDVSKRTLHEIFFPPFKKAVDAGAWTLMAAHNEVNGIPCHASEYLLTDILRNEWDFKGFVVSDWHDIEALYRIHYVADGMKDATKQALLAGVDMHMYGEGFAKPAVELVEEGAIPISLIDAKVKLILETKFRLGLFENRYVDLDEIENVIASKEHREVALQIARESIVLLKNENQLLPIKSDTKKIFLTGPNATGNAILGDWTWKQPEENVFTVVKGLQENLPENMELNYFDCGNIYSITDSSIALAVKEAEQSDIALVVVGGNNFRDGAPDRTGGENWARSDIKLYGKQIELVQAIEKTGTPTVVILINGRPLAIPWIAENIPSILETWEPGMEGGKAIADVLFGEYNPSGKLPFSIPRSVGQLQYWYNYKPSREARDYKFGETGPLYDFGHGLSYTTFEYSNLTFTDKVSAGDDVKVKITIKNTGSYSGDEIVQIYLNDEVSSVTTPVRKLVAFQKISLEPNEEKIVTLTIPSIQLALYNREMKQVIEPGVFKVMAGGLIDKFEVVE
ncbi:MAG: glycoside hydrolase family 3 C-terminal domain-containing protein [Melioribacteraceae bacterium]|nr:glycoside hydrolase family 3 C-terminal domain-containing protein [Melioribacteraceae bacterium]